MPCTRFCIYVSTNNIYEKKTLQGLCESAGSYAPFPSGPGRDLGVCILTSSLGKPEQQALSLALASAGRVEWSLAVLGGLPHQLEVLGQCFGV